MKAKNIFLYFLIALLISTNKTNAQWVQTNGPYGGNIRSIAVSGTNIFAGTDGGIFLSTNNGNSWTEVNNGLTIGAVDALAVSGANIFAGHWGGGMFLSINNGSSWTAVNTGLTNKYVYSLAISGTTIYAGTSGGVFLSTNNGSSWTAVNAGLTNTTVYSLAISGANIFAGTSGGVFLSTNNGSSWIAVNTGLTSTNIYTLIVSGSNIFAGTWGGGVFLSTNNGSSWSAANNGLTYTYVIALVTDGTNIFAGTPGGGVFLSTNNGSSWTAVNNGLTATKVWSLAISGTNIFAGTNSGGGVFLSTNKGSSWTAMNADLASITVNLLATSGTNIFVGTNSGVFLSTNDGANWTAVNNGLNQNNISSLAISGPNIFAGTNVGVFLSTNNGSSWTAVNTGLTNTNVSSLAISGPNIFAGTGDGGVFLSTNNGSSWVSVNNGLTNPDVQSLLISGTNIFAGTFGGGVFLSTNNGLSWTAVNNGLTNLTIRSLLVSGTNIFAGTFGGGVFLSTNNGLSWTAINNGLTNLKVQSLLISGTNIFAGTFGGGVFLSTNNGSSWSAVNNGLTANAVISIAISGANIFAAKNGWVLSPLAFNSGRIWRRPLSEMNIYSITLISPNGGEVWTTGSSHNISWSVNGNIDAYVDLKYSTNNGSNWNVITSGLGKNNSPYTWNIPSGINSDQCKVKIIGTYNSSQIASESNAAFTIKNVVEVKTPSINISSSVINNNGNLQVTGSNFSPSGTVKLNFTGPSGVAIPTVTITADANGKIVYTFSANTNMQPGYYYVVATDVTTNKLTSAQKFQIISEPENHKLTLNSPKQGSQFSSGDNLTVSWSDQMVLGSNYIIDGARRKYNYKIELSTDGGSTWKEGTTLTGKEEVNKVVSFSKNILLTEVGGNNKIRVTDLYRNSSYAVSGTFSVIVPQSVDIKTLLVWDYSFPERNGEPIGVACDGVARVYLKVYNANTSSTDNINKVTISLSDADNNTEARILGKLQIASTIDSYSEEANNASALTITNSNPAPDRTFWFWYVAPDEFCGKNSQDTTALDRTVKANITITYQSGKIENTSKIIKVVRPPLLLAHGLGGSPSTWNSFSYLNNGKYTRYLDDERFLVRKALDLDWRAKFWNNAKGILLGHSNPNGFYVNIQEMRRKQFASNQIIYIGHSMGGNVVREAINIGVNKKENYNKGYLNKVITLDTPYLGSPFADLIYDLIEKIKEKDKAQVMSSIINNFLNYDSRSLPNSLCTPVPSGNSLISASGACEDLRVNGGVKSGRTDLPFHLVAADIVSGDQNLPEIPSYVYQLFNYADDFFDFFDKVIKIIDVLGTPATSQYIKEISGLNKIERVIKFCEYMMKAYEGAAFLVDSDVIVSVKSQLSTLSRDSKNKVSVFSPNVWHLNVHHNNDVGNRVNTLINGNKGQYFGSIPASLHKSNTPSFNIFSSNTNKSTNNPKSNAIVINSPVQNSIISVDSLFNVSFIISDTTKLSNVSVYFQNQVYSSNNVSNQYSFSIQANGNLLDTQKVEVIATFSNQDSPYLLYVYMNVIVNPNTQPNSFRASEKTVYLMKNQPYYPNYTAIFPKFISQISSKSPYLSITVSNPQILQYDNQNKMFKSLAEGETSVIVNYRGVADTIYFVIDKTDYLTTVAEDNSPNNKTIIPTEYLLEQNYPNPFNPNTTIKYSIPRASLVNIKIYDILGREVEKLVDEEKSPGQYQVLFSAKGLASGVYFYQIRAGNFISTKKLVLLK